MKKRVLYLSVLITGLLVACSSTPNEEKIKKIATDVKTTDIADSSQPTETTETEAVEGKIKIVGTTDGVEGDVITLEQAVGNSKTTIESVRLDKKGEFEFKKGIKKYGFYRVNLNDKAYAYIVADKKKIKINFDIANNKVEVLNSPESLLYQKYLRLITGFHSEVKRVRSAAIEINSKRDTLILLQQNYHQTIKKFVLDNSPSNVALNASKEFAQKAYEHKDFFTKILEIYKDEKYAKEFLSLVEANVNKTPIAPGYIAPDFELATPEGQAMKLSDLRGQYVLIDFWASWCGPCRRENPNVVKMYDKYHSKGFEILGVSLDRNKGSWKGAIAKDGLAWKHVSDLKQWNSVVVPLYGVKGIPMTVLVDKEGKIIARDLRGPSLEAKLAELFD